VSHHDLAWRWVTTVAGTCHVIINTTSRILDLRLEITTAHFRMVHAFLFAWWADYISALTRSDIDIIVIALFNLLRALWRFSCSKFILILADEAEHASKDEASDQYNYESKK
jgi:hypothetical protein